MSTTLMFSYLNFNFLSFFFYKLIENNNFIELTNSIPLERSEKNHKFENISLLDEV